MKNAMFNINAVAMLVVSMMFSYVGANLMVQAGAMDEQTAYSWGFIIGRALMGVLLPLGLVYLPLAMRQGGRPTLAKGAYFWWWSLFFLLSIMGMLGSTVPPNAV